MAASPHRPGRRRLRAALSWLHLWLGLVAGSAFAVVALAGTVLVFHVDLLKLQHPDLAGHEAVADGRVLERIVDEWGPRGLRSLDLPRDGLPVWQGYFEDGRRGYFAPVDGSLLLTRSHHDDWLMWLHELHVELLGGKAGKEALGVIGWIALGLLLSGLYLWWPKPGRWLAQLKVHAGPPTRRWLTWHRGSGVVLLPLVLLVSLTGVGMIYGNGFRTVLAALFGGATHAAPVADATVAAPDWSRVLAGANAALPGARVNRVAVPGAGDGVVGFRARAAGEWHPVGRSTIHLDHSGSLLQVVDATADPAGTRIHQAIYPLHIGAVGGAAMRWLTALAGLMPAFLLVTGFLFWRRRRGR
ncbi:PepSY-associated TM helix domain-containing protein [Luteimonas sp. RD2P54]|uniref:PepSY-associated TM helix domain-containing protein n=1 Tax=Luteimonas endophytica TaxID=3042023 RepID=A0ABT6J4Z0_9GAMM|nr:PepSY-associated TM helix domain-containing protein [Luteimonas endophytica]MDH5821839.1 PepSY-associated TM helix domain-containing protein [Luteimonas endophytica]